ncbi:MAG TPA: TetR/AcrR family transcriptional regulator [Solirubrobacterales bacterium]|nr:TetR/AcrR family transcriptional regulator [Solirubrobacterales bacterium]
MLDAAVVVFARQGISRTSLSEIAAEAGLTKGAVYSNFGSKDELLLAIMEDHLIERMRDVAAVFDGGLSTPDAVRAAGARLLAAMVADATWHQLLLEYWTLALHDEAVMTKLAAKRAEVRATVARAIAAAADAHGVTLPISPEELAVTLMALSNGYAVERAIDTAAVPDQLFEKVLGLLVAMP